MGVAVSNTPGANAGAVAELAITMLLCLLRKVSKCDRDMRNGIWKRELNRSLSGTLGLVGYGAVAQSFAKLLMPFPVRVLAYDVAFNEKAAREAGVSYAGLDEMLPRCDFLSIHVPVTPATIGLVDGAFIRKMKAGAILINTSRGSVVDESALIAALEEKQLAGAALDVFEQEPINPDNPLLARDNTVLSPHAASMSAEALLSVAAQCAANILDFECGRDLKYSVT
jgi:phosphoglycerate dehydrogenase-like enzyme